MNRKQTNERKTIIEIPNEILAKINKIYKALARLIKN